MQNILIYSHCCILVVTVLAIRVLMSRMRWSCAYLAAVTSGFLLGVLRVVLRLRSCSAFCSRRRHQSKSLETVRGSQVRLERRKSGLAEEYTLVRSERGVHEGLLCQAGGGSGERGQRQARRLRTHTSRAVIRSMPPNSITYHQSDV